MLLMQIRTDAKNDADAEADADADAEGMGQGKRKNSGELFGKQKDSASGVLQRRVCRRANSGEIRTYVRSCYHSSITNAAKIKFYGKSAENLQMYNIHT